MKNPKFFLCPHKRTDHELAIHTNTQFEQILNTQNTKAIFLVQITTKLETRNEKSTQILGTLFCGAQEKSNLLLKITWIVNENRKLWVRVKTVIMRKLIAIM